MLRIPITRIRGLGFILWHARHMVYHVFLGLAWAWILKDKWGGYDLRLVLTCVFGSVAPDLEHLLYFFTYGKKDAYSREIRSFLKEHEWRVATVFIEKGHKYNTNLRFHNIYVIGLLLIFTTVSFSYDWHVWTALFGAMISHYVFDIFDDLATLGHVNPNWVRWGREES